ncbi:MAG: protein BatD [Bacteroidales bacterium]|nr:protein BatD [Bacteroidales bacterium]
MQTRLFKILISLILGFVSLTAGAEEVTFVGKAPSAVAVGDRFQLTYTLSNADSRDIRLAEIDGFDILVGPSMSRSSSTQIINGQISQSSSTTFTYILKAQKEGTFRIEGASVYVSGEKLTSNALTIEVSNDGGSQQSQQGGQQSPDNSGVRSSVVDGAAGSDIIVTQSLTKSSVYPGESVELVTKVYTRVDIESASVSEAPKLTEFVTQDMEPNSTPNREQVNGYIYTSQEVSRQVLIPQKSGRITIEPIEFEFIVKKRVGGGGRGFFDDFFSEVQRVRQRVKSKSVSINVKELPAGKPAGFSGGVGSFNFNVSVSPQEVKTDNSVQVKVSVSGTGNLKLLSLPKPQFHSDFDTFDPKETNDVKVVTAGYKGTKSAEYLIIPRHDGEFTIPEMTFSFFDPSQGRYVTQKQGPFTIKVEKGEGQSSSGVVSFSGGSREQVKYIGKDLRYMRTAYEKLQPSRTFFLWSPAFFACTLIPLAILIVLFFIYRKRIRDNANMAQVKMRKANKQARRRLKQAAKYIKDNKREAFFDEVMRALWGYLSDKLTLPLSDLTKDNAIEEMQHHNIDDKAAAEFMSLLDSCEFARYAPTELSESMESVYNKALEVIGKMDNNIK